MMRRGLVVCTANVCRSPVAARLLQRAIEDRQDVDGLSWMITSAAIAPPIAPMDANTISAAAEVGVDLSEHRPRQLDASVLATDGADLVLVMERAHLPHVVDVDPDAWLRTFTIKELARRAMMAAPASSEEGFEPWRARLGAGRTAAGMIKPSPLDDIADPYGAPRREHGAMVGELVNVVAVLVEHGPWRQGLG
jgi:protein-tyrosine phosphatase